MLQHRSSRSSHLESATERSVSTRSIYFKNLHFAPRFMISSENPTYRRKNLVILRAGDDSLHRGWISHNQRDFDLFISYYGKIKDQHRSDAEYYEMRPGPKWPCIAELLDENPTLIDRYDAFWFPDDDIAATTDTINRMFALFHGFQLSLAQPALTPDSFYSWDSLLQNPRYLLRFSKFVEVMVPIFDRIALRACIHTFKEGRSGWGLDWLWPQLCGRGRPDSIAIIDATPVRHTRPLGGALYKNNPDMDPKADERRILEKFNLLEARLFNKYNTALGAIARVQPPWHHRLWMQLRKMNSKRRHKRREKLASTT